MAHFTWPQTALSFITCKNCAKFSQVFSNLYKNVTLWQITLTYLMDKIKVNKCELSSLRDARVCKAQGKSVFAGSVLVETISFFKKVC